MELLERCKQLCLKKPKTVLLPDALDLRVLRAARYLKDNRLAEPVLIGSPVHIREVASAAKLRTNGIKVRKPEHDAQFDHLVRALCDKRKDKGLTRREAAALLKKPVWYAADRLRRSAAELCASGSVISDIVEAGVWLTGLQDDTQTVSGFCLLAAPDTGQVFLFADGLIVPRPDEKQLADIAIAAGKSFEQLTGQEARVAMLSFSTAGSAEHPLAQKVVDALKLVRERQPGLLADGEVQFDAAMTPRVAAQKMPAGRLEGRANVFVFPSLNAADIGVKMAQHLGGYRAFGPFIQGLKKPFYYIDGESTSEEIVNGIVLASCLA